MYHNRLMNNIPDIGTFEADEHKEVFVIPETNIQAPLQKLRQSIMRRSILQSSVYINHSRDCPLNYQNRDIETQSFLAANIKTNRKTRNMAQKAFTEQIPMQKELCQACQDHFSKQNSPQRSVQVSDAPKIQMAKQITMKRNSMMRGAFNNYKLKEVNPKKYKRDLRPHHPKIYENRAAKQQQSIQHHRSPEFFRTITDQDCKSMSGSTSIFQKLLKVKNQRTDYKHTREETIEEDGSMDVNSITSDDERPQTQIITPQCFLQEQKRTNKNRNQFTSHQYYNSTTDVRKVMDLTNFQNSLKGNSPINFDVSPDKCVEPKKSSPHNFGDLRKMRFKTISDMDNKINNQQAKKKKRTRNVNSSEDFRQKLEDAKKTFIQLTQRKKHIQPQDRIERKNSYYKQYDTNSVIQNNSYHQDRQTDISKRQQSPQLSLSPKHQKYQKQFIPSPKNKVKVIKVKGILRRSKQTREHESGQFEINDDSD